MKTTEMNVRDATEKMATMTTVTEIHLIAGFRCEKTAGVIWITVESDIPCAQLERGSAGSSIREDNFLGGQHT